MTNNILKIVLQLDPDTRYQLIEDVSNDVGDRGTDVGAKCSFYQPKKWKDNHYDWLVDLVKEKIQSELDSNLSVVDYWFMSYEYGEEVEPHEHCDKCDWVAIYYFEAPEGSGVLHFTDLDISVYPYTNLLIVHRSNLWHQVLSNTDPNITRYSLVMNLKMDGINEPL